MNFSKLGLSDRAMLWIIICRFLNPAFYRVTNRKNSTKKGAPITDAPLTLSFIKSIKYSTFYLRSTKNKTLNELQNMDEFLNAAKNL